MTPETVAGLRCPVCRGALMLMGRSLRCAKGHSFDLAREGYVNLLPIQKKHAADPGDGREMVRARRRFLEGAWYAPFRQALGELCCRYAPREGPARIVDAGCGEGSYDLAVWQALDSCGTPPALIGFDLSKEAVRLAAKLVPQAAFAVGGSFCAPVRDGWADILLNVFSPFARKEFLRMLRPGGILLYAVPTARHLYGLKEVLYQTPYENPVQQTEYEGLNFVGRRDVEETITLEGEQIRDLFAMTPYYWNTPADGVQRLAACSRLTTEIGFGFLVYQKPQS